MLCIQKWAKVHGKPELYILLFTMHMRDMPDQSHIKVRSMQISGTEAIRTQIQPSKPLWEINNITNRQHTKENIWLTE